MYENHELVIILSSLSIQAVRTDQECIVCNKELPKGSLCYSFGIIDRLHGRKKRWYVCSEHRYIFNYSSIEDCPPWHQEFLEGQRLTNEIWIT